MDEVDFDRIVSEDVKNLLPMEQSDFLRLPHNQDKWRSALLRLIRSLDEQISELTKDEVTATKNLPNHMITEYKISSDEKRTKINRFRFYVLQRIAEVERNIALGEEGRSDDMNLAAFLSRAIEEHRSLMEAHSFEPTPIDEALYRSTEGTWGFTDMDSKLDAWTKDIPIP
tara:strand:- start:1561 stop:2073 length:513 start_codon:yes stop_codon:yes gene_type:complete